MAGRSYVVTNIEHNGQKPSIMLAVSAPYET